MTLLYLTTWDFCNEESDGVCKKIKSQISALRKNGIKVDLIYIRNHDVLFQENAGEEIIAHVGNIKKTPAYFKMRKFLRNRKYDWVYNRFGLFDTFYVNVLKTLKQNGARILVEVPTYPYTGERNPGFLNWLMFAWDRFEQRKIRSIIDRVVDTGHTKSIWGIPTICIKNGYDVEAVPLASRKKDNVISFGTAALLQPYHGFERLILAMDEYYNDNTGTKEEAVFHIVGDGPERKFYEELVKKKGLEDKIRFHGLLGGKKLDEIYDLVDVGVCSLGCYKKNLFFSGELKSREYLSRGIPFVLSCDLDMENELEEDMFIKVPNDSSILDFSSLIDFAKESIANREKIAIRMRSLAEDIISEEKAFFPVIDYLHT